MVGKNNHIRTVKSNLKEHYKAYKAGRRWVYASLASLALGAGLLLGNTTAFADETATTTQDPAASVTKDAGNAATTQTASTVPLKTGTTATDTSNTTAVDSSNKQATDNANESANADVKPSANVKPSDTTTASVGKSADTAAQNTPATTSDTTATKPASTPTADATPADGSSNSEQSAASKTLVDPTEEQLSAAKASAEKVYDATHQAQEIDAVADDPGQTADATLKVSVPAVGYNSGAKDSFTVTFKAAANAGDTYVINLPADSGVFGYKEVQPLTPTAGTTTTVTNPDGTRTITDVFTTATPTTQVITFYLNNNYLDQGPKSDVGKTVTKTITWSENSVAQTPVTFTQTITPTVNLSPVVQSYPNVQKVPAVLPDKNYMFSIKVNEPDGVLDDGYPSNWINRAANYGGTTITIPVPTGFKLDTDETNAINAFSDGQTITQPGGSGTDLVISAPAGTGKENWQNDGLGYKFIGSFDITQPATDTVLTATSPVTFNQVMNSDNDTLKATGDPWSVKILGVNAGGSAVGNSTTPDAKASNTSLLLDDDPTDDPAYLSAYGLVYDSPADTTGAQIKITIPDGLDATSVHVPDSGITPSLYLPGTTSYAYTLTLADGSTETGTVDAGGKITPSSTSSIRTIILTPNTLAPGANFKASGPDSTSLYVNGTLSHTYDNGNPVQTGDQLTSTITVSYADPKDPGTTISKSASIKQTVVEAVALGIGYKDQSSTMPGFSGDGNDLRAQGGNYQQSSTKIFEPTYYFVIPTATTIKSITGWPQAKISTFKADDGRTVAKVDYSGTGVTINTNIENPGKNAQVNLSNNADALPGKYPYLMYIVSPTSKLKNTTKVVDTSYTEGNPDALLMQGGSGDWNIVTASSFFNTTFAKGNTDTDPVLNGTSDDQGDPTLTFYDNVVYTSLDEDAKDSKASVAINLPTVGDTKNSQYTFKLTKAIDVPANYTTVNGDGTGTAINPTVLYSTQPQAVTTATTPDTTGYVTADQVTDWSSIRSILIQMSDIKANTSTGRIAITGTTDNFKQQAGKTATLQTIFYGNGAKASVNPKGDASIAITGTSTIKARYHYTDSTGADQYIDLDDLSKTLNDNADTFTNDYPTQLSDFSATDQGLIPAGFKLVTDASGKATPIIVDGTGDGKAEFGQVAQYYYDGDFVQYELVGNVNAKVEFVDDDNNGVIVGTPTTISGTSGGTANWTANNIPTGYKLATGQADHGTYTFTDGSDQTVQIHLVHVVDETTTNTTRTITYTGVANGNNPDPTSQPLTWKVDTDQVTGVTTYTPNGGYPEVTVPPVTGYTPSEEIVPAGTDTATTTKPSNTELTVTYTADPADLTVTYVDTDENNKVVGTPTTLNGTTDQTGTYTVTIPDNYVLAPGQNASVPYQFKAGNDTSDNVTIQLAHKHNTNLPDGFTGTTHRIINYTGVADGNNPASVSQPLNWTTDTDQVTSVTTYTPSGHYPAADSPKVDGYTPNQETVPVGTDAITTTQPKDSSVTVTYTAGNQNATVEYVDDDDNGAVVGTPTTISGKTSGTADWNTNDKPAGYHLAAGQAASGTYTFTADKDQTVKIHLTHIITYSAVTTTRTINYVVDDPNYTGQVPETQTQTINWKLTTDEATGETVATPQGAYYAQTAPTIPGYTPDKGSVGQQTVGAVTSLPGDETATVTYTPSAETATVEYVDDNNNGAVVGTPTTISGKTSGTADWNTNDKPAGYHLAAGQAASGTYQFTNGTDQTVKIHLTHIVNYSTATTIRTINYVVDDPNYTGQVPETQTQTINWKLTTDEATGEMVATPQGAYYAQTAPTIPGYTPDKGSVGQQTVGAVTSLPDDETATVTYTPSAETATVEYVDDDNNGAVVGTPTTISGKTSGTADWNTDDKPAGYHLAANQAASGTYTFTADKDQTVKIHLTHIITYSTATTTRTINYVVDDPNYMGQVPETQTQTINWKLTTDEATGEMVATPQGAYYAQAAPTIPGYTADPTSVEQLTYGPVTGLPANQTATVHYTADNQSAKVEYVDDANGGAVVGNPTTITGKTSGTATWNTDNMPAGYKLAKGQAASGTYQFTNDNQTVQIHLSHIIDNTTATTTRTITYVVDDPNYTGQVPAAKTQTITWNVTTDEVNGHMVAIPQSGYAEETAPALDGYTADPLSVAQQSYAGVTSLPDNETATVTYTPNNQTVTLEYVDDDNDGAVVGTPTTLSGKTSGKVDWNTDNKPTGYSLATGQAGSGTYQFTTGSDQLIQVHLNHVIEYTTTKTTRTVHFVVDDPNYTGQTPAPMVQTVIWNVATDKATGVSVATPQTGYYEETVPSLPGYTASQTKVGQQALGSVAASDVPMYNEDVVVTYTPDVQTTPSDGEGVPGEPTEPTGPTTPEEPTGTGSITGEIVPETPAPGEAISTTPETGGKGSATSGNAGTSGTTGYAGTTQDVNGAAATVSNDQSKTSAASQGKLPQTNEQSHSEVGLGLLGLLTSMLGLVGLKRRKRDDE